MKKLFYLICASCIPALRCFEKLEITSSDQTTQIMTANKQKKLAGTHSTTCAVTSTFTPEEDYRSNLYTELRIALYIAERTNIYVTDCDFILSIVSNTIPVGSFQRYTNLDAITVLVNCISNPFSPFRERVLNTFTQDLGLPFTQSTSSNLAAKFAQQYKRMQHMHQIISWMHERLPGKVEGYYSRLGQAAVQDRLTGIPFRYFLPKERYPELESTSKSEIYSYLFLLQTKAAALAELELALKITRARLKHQTPEKIKYQMQGFLRKNLALSLPKGTAGKWCKYAQTYQPWQDLAAN
jgi:hypothetical protein